MTYQIESSHTPEECLKALDEVLAKGPQNLAKYDWGCMSGDHRGWATIEAKSESEAQNLIPTSLRAKTRVVPVTKFSPDQIRSFHQK
jgi:hypothetical protein